FWAPPLSRMLCRLSSARTLLPDEAGGRETRHGRRAGAAAATGRGHARLPPGRVPLRLVGARPAHAPRRRGAVRRVLGRRLRDPGAGAVPRLPAARPAAVVQPQYARPDAPDCAALPGSQGTASRCGSSRLVAPGRL